MNELLLKLAEVIGQSVKTCPDPLLLTRLLEEGAVTQERMESLSHLEDCDECREWLDMFETHRQDPRLSEQTLWGSALLVAVFGTAEMLDRELKQLLVTLRSAGWWVSSLADEVCWAAISVGTGTRGGDPIDGKKVAERLTSLEQRFRPGGKVGGVVYAGRGLLGKHGPIGELFEFALAQVDAVRPGLLSLSPPVALLVHPKSATLAWNVGVNRRGEARFRYISHPMSLHADADLRIRPVRVNQRRSAVTGALEASVKDAGSIRIEFNRQAHQHVRVLLAQPDRVRIDPEGGEWSDSGDADPSRIQFVLKGVQGLEQPVLLVSDAPISGLEALVAQINQEPSSYALSRIDRLYEVLRDTAAVPAFSLLAAPRSSRS